MDEREAIERRRGGDIEGLATLVTRYQTEATRIAQLITRDRALAEMVCRISNPGRARPAPARRTIDASPASFWRLVRRGTWW